MSEPTVTLRAYEIVCAERDALRVDLDTLLAARKADTPRIIRRIGPLPPQIVAEVRRRSYGKCVACGKQGRDPHHVLPQQRWPELRLVADLIVWVCRRCHDNHEAASHRIPYEALPPCVFDQAMRIADPRINAYIHNTYPRAVAA